jgi:hypothetical protein
MRCAMFFKPKRLLFKLSKALDAFAMHRMQAAVPDSDLRRARSDIKRLRRLLHGAPREGGGRGA